jgi:type I restriction enzyme S subunit
MKKKATARTAKAISRPSMLDFPTSSEADLVAESTSAETSTKTGAKSRRKRTADFADDADKHNESHCDSSVPVSSAPTERNKIAQGKKQSAAALGQHPSITESPKGATEPTSSAKNRRKRTADFADKTNESHCDSSAISAQSGVKTNSSTGMEAKSVTDNVWPIAPLGQIAEVKLGKMLDKTKHHSGRKFPYLRNVNVRWGVVETHDVFEMYFEDEQVDRFNLEVGDVVVCEGGEPGRAAVWNGQIPEMKFQKAIHRVRFKIPFEPRLLVYFLEWLAKSGQLDRRFTGSTIKHFTRESFVQLPIPLPPPAEQHRIVAEIEKQFTRLDAGVAALKRVQANLKRYRAAVLKAACEGKLVPTEAELAHREARTYETGEQLLQRILTQRRQNWQGRGRHKEPTEPETSNLFELPVGWTWATVEQLAAPEPNSITDGPFGSNLKTEHYMDSGPRVIRLQNIGDGVYVDEEAHISQAHFERLQKHRVFAGDVVIAGFGENPPRSCIIPESLGPAIVKADCIRFKPNASVMPKYVNAALNSDPVRKRTKGMVHGVGRPRLNLGEIKSIVLPLPPLAEQTRIVAEVERRLSVVDELETVVSANLQRATRLRQSILQKAFNGEL